MDFPRIIIGYHGCRESLANELLSGTRTPADWPVSRKKWDWLGWGIYFWEFGPRRAQRWADAKAEYLKEPCTVIAAVIQLGNGVLDLTDVRVKPLFGAAYEQLADEYSAKDEPLPKNKELRPAKTATDPDRKLRMLDCLVIDKVCDTFTRATPPQPISAVRGAFEEGGEMFPGAMLKEETHIQVAVRDPRIILGVFKPF
jgi:hypothetical protein